MGENTQPGIKRLWGIAKSPGLRLTDEELHYFVAAHTGKDSIKKLSQRELQQMIGLLTNMRNSAYKAERGQTVRGNSATENQRKKIYVLARELGWDKPARVNGLCRKMFQVDRVEWLDYQQCSKLIEALKGMAKRKQEGEKDVPDQH